MFHSNASPAGPARLAAAAIVTAAAVALVTLPAQAQQQQQKKQAPQKKQAQPAPQAPAQPAQPQMPQLIYSPWTKFCLKGKDANAKEVCFTGKDGRIESGMPVVAAVLIEPEGEAKKILRVTVPLGMQIQHGTRVIVDQNTPMTSPYVICFTNGCMSDYDATADLIGKLTKGKNLVVQAINANSQPISLNLPLSDFSKAHEGPPTDPKVFEEQQKKLQEELQRRADETRKRLEAQPPGQTPPAQTPPAAQPAPPAKQ
jgi:invasion protein IalB